MTDLTSTTDLTDETAAIVAVGNFNPRIFHPEWLRRHEVIGEREAEACIERGLEFLHPELTVLNLDQMKLEVSLDRLQVSANEAPLVRCKDFTLNLFRLLPHSPVRELGLNFSTTFCARRREDWDALGDKLVPKAPWGALGSIEEGARDVGLRQLAVEQNPRPDGRPGYRRVLITALNQPQFATQVMVNDHYDLATAGSDASNAADILDVRWLASSGEAADIVLSMRGLTRAV